MANASALPVITRRSAMMDTPMAMARRHRRHPSPGDDGHAHGDGATSSSSPAARR